MTDAPDTRWDARCKKCPRCGADTRGIADIYVGPPEGIDNFDQQADVLVVEDGAVVARADTRDGGDTPGCEADTALVSEEVSTDAEGDGWADHAESVAVSLGADPEAFREAVAEVDAADREGREERPGVVTTERWCTAPDCSWSERRV